MADRGYALDLGWPVRHVVTEMEGSESGLSVSELARTFKAFPADLGRIRLHEGCTSDEEAKRWLMQTALDELSRYVAEDDGRYTLAVPVEKVRWDRRRVHPIPADEDGSLDLERQVRAAYSQMRLGAAFSVKVEGARGSMKERRLKLHALAMMLPLMPEDEFTELLDDVRTNGFTSPVHVIGDEVLDGRHRVAVASALDVPLRVVEFTGTAEEAKHFVVSLNLRRRHLTTPQRTQIVREVFLPELAAEAAKRRSQAPGQPKGVKQSPTVGTEVRDPDNPPKEKRNKTAAQLASERSGGLATTRAINMMAPVDNAPATRQRVMSGEIKTVDQARRAALREIGSPEPAKLPAEIRGTWDSLGRSLYWLRHAIKAQRAGVGLGKRRSAEITREDHLKRLAEIRALCDEYEAGLDGAE